MSLPAMMFGKTISHTFTLNPADLTFEEVMVNDAKCEQPVLKGAQPCYDLGTPSLPRVYNQFVVPLLAKNIVLENVSFDGNHAIEGMHTIAPVVRDESTTNDFEPKIVVKDYPSDTIVKPSACVSHVENYMDYFRVVQVEVSPFMYDAQKGQLSLYKSVTFTIKYDVTDSDFLATAHDKSICRLRYDGAMADIDFIASQVVNPQDIADNLEPINQYARGEFPSHPGGFSSQTSYNSYRYTIITSRNLAPSFERLVTLKKMQGIDAGIVYVEDILSNLALSRGDVVNNICDSAAIVRAYLLNHSNTIQYVLLGGKPPIVPIRYGYYKINYKAGEEGENYIPTDLYFGSPSDVNWNYDNVGDDKYGKYNSTFSYGSMFKIGRLLCTTPEDVENYLDKLEIYMLNPGFGDRDYLKNAFTCISSKISLPSYSVDVRNAVESEFQMHDFYAYGVNETPLLYGNDVISTINNNNWGVIGLHGHGQPGGLSVMDKDSYNLAQYPEHRLVTSISGENLYSLVESNNGLDGIDNFGYPSVMVTHSCTTSAFDSPRYLGYGRYMPAYDVISSSMAASFTNGKNYGGVGYIGYTRPVYTSEGRLMICDYYNLLDSADVLSQGEIVNRCVLRSHYRHSGAHIDKIGYNLVGDPSLNVWSGTQDIINYPPVDYNITDSILEYRLPVADNTNPVVALSPNGNIYNIALRIPLPPPSPMNAGPVTPTYAMMGKVNPYSTVYGKRSNNVPSIGDMYVPGDVVFDRMKYFYSNNLTLGIDTASVVSTTVTFTQGSNYTFYAKGVVRLGGNLSIPENTVVTIYSDSIISLEGVCVNANGTLRLSSPAYANINSVSNEIDDGRIELLEFDKYGVNHMYTCQHSPRRFSTETSALQDKSLDCPIDKISLKIDGSEINIMSPFAKDGFISDIQGRKILDCSIKEGINSIRTDKLTNGVYMLCIGNQIYKIVIKK